MATKKEETTPQRRRGGAKSKQTEEAAKKPSRARKKKEEQPVTQSPTELTDYTAITPQYDENGKRVRALTATAGGLVPDEKALESLNKAMTKKGSTTPTLRMGVTQRLVTMSETGIFQLDYALLGGIPEGAITQIYGWESGGKTTAAMRAVAGVQRKYPDKVVCWADAEQTFNPIWAQAHGVDLTRLVFIDPETGLAEDYVDAVKTALKDPITAMVVVDSLPALVPATEAGKDAEEHVVARRAALVGRMCSYILTSIQECRLKGGNPSVILINQFRMKIGVVMGDPRTLPCGVQVQYQSSTKIEIKKVKEHEGKDDHEINIKTHTEHGFTVAKCKAGISSKTGEFTMIADPSHPLGSGAIDDARRVINYAKRVGVVTGGGSSWRLDGVDQVFPNLYSMQDFLNDDDYEYTLLKARLIAMRRQQVGLPAVPVDGYLCGMTHAELAERMDV